MPRAERRIAAAIGRTKKGEELGIEAAAGFVGVEGTMEDAKGLASDIAKRAASEALSQTDNVLSTAATNGFRRYLASREFQDAIVKEIGQAAEPIIAEVIPHMPPPSHLGNPSPGVGGGPRGQERLATFGCRLVSH